MKRRNITASQDTVAELNNVHVTEGGILNGVSLKVERGEIVLVTGESGSGKSTALRALEGIVIPSAGEVRLFGQNLADLSRNEQRRLIAARVGVGFQTHNLQTGRSVLDNLTTSWYTTRSGRPPRDHIAHLAARLGIAGERGEMLDRPASTLSGGQMHRVALGRLLLTQPDLMLFDEPTAALDTHGEYGKSRIYDLIADEASQIGAAVVIASHDEAAHRIATREVTLDGGIVVPQGFVHQSV